MADEKKEEKKPTQASPKLTKLIEEIETLSVVELADLVKALEEKFGVSAMTVAPPASGATPVGGETPAAGAAPAGQTTFNVVLASAGDSKIGVIKVVREINQNLGLKEAKDLVDSAPKDVLTGVNKETAEEAKKKLEAAGAKVELK
jgi:large subunit ribosomal protein L7/L12